MRNGQVEGIMFLFKVELLEFSNIPLGVMKGNVKYVNCH